MEEEIEEKLRAFDDRRNECWYLLGDIQKARHIIQMMENDSKEYIVNILMEHEKKLEREARELLNRIINLRQQEEIKTRKANRPVRKREF